MMTAPDGDADAEALMVFDLDDEERHLLRCGLVEWGGPARCTEEMAVAMGFLGVADLLDETDRLIAAVGSGRALSRIDWCRVLLATEIVFASDLVGSGHDWSSTTGMSDERTIAVLRRLQARMTGRLRGLIGNGLGTRAL